MMDLDRFKGYNDRNGHPAGDELLAAVSRAIESCIRQGDRAYRYGGDEFAVILPDCGRQRGRGGRPPDPRRDRVDPRQEWRPARDDQRRRRLPSRGRDRQGDPRRDRRPGAVRGQGRAVPRLPRPVRRGPRRDDDRPARRQRHRRSCSTRSSTGPLACWASGAATSTWGRPATRTSPSPRASATRPATSGSSRR